ncbi:Galactoside 2-alpha-L-fucosyltransferase 1 [Portunus trituberculatus]|uniref:L-Fucosyltransferase n=1 Tax=Portunus trituberculatus TaxID=210409 RepID=A0A5B7GYI4_PORTR|nr:Galactoside 2-alpha-L-fucosyltransferase 1 [Portunus trituberculatus]
MGVFQQKRTITRMLGFLCLFNALVIIGLSYRQQWVPLKEANNTVLKLPRAALENLLKIYRNAVASKTKQHAVPRLTPIEKPKTYPSKSGCFPYFSKLGVQAVAENDCNKPYVTMNKSGRLGNKMCQYASLYLLRHLFGVRLATHKQVAIFDEMHTTLDKIFKNIDIPVKKPDCFVGDARGTTYTSLYDKLYRAEATAQNTITSNIIIESLLDTPYHIYNFPAPRDLLLEHRNLIHSLFNFRDEVKQNAIRNIDNVLRSFNATYHHRDFPIVTVHVRRTDYERHLKNRFNLTQLDKLYFINAFEFYKKRFCGSSEQVIKDLKPPM